MRNGILVGAIGFLQPFLDSLPDGIAPITDDFAGEVQLLDSQAGFTGRKTYRMLGSRVNAVNGNDRVYPRDLMTDAIKRWKESRKGALGQEPHPESYVMQDGKLGWKEITANNVIKVLDIHLPDEQGNVFFDFQCLDTAKGKDLQATLDAGGKPGCSLRAGGRGKAAKLGDRTVTVATFLDVFTFDIVPNPALSATLGSVVALTDSQVENLLTTEVLDSVDAQIDKLKSAASLVDLLKIKNAVEQIALDAIDRAAFETAYWRRRYQIIELLEAEAAEKRVSRIGFTDSQSVKQSFVKNDAVIPLVGHMKGQKGKVATVSKVVTDEAFYALDFGDGTPHKWYADSELKKTDKTPNSNSKKMDMEMEDNQKKGDGALMKYTFEQLSAMTDAELQAARKEAPECAAMIDAIAAQRKTEADLKALQDAQAKRDAADAARAYMDSQEVKDKLGKLPASAQELVRKRVDLTSKEAAEKTFTDAFEFAVSMGADDKLKKLGFDKEKPMTDAQATTNLEFGDEAQGWREFSDKLREATADHYRMFQGTPDQNLIKLNKPIIDQFMKEFDKRNAAELVKFADDINSASSTVSLINGVGFYRQIIEQAFQTMVALQFVQVQPFSGEFMEIPRETYARSNNRPTANGEMQPMAKSKLSIDYMHVAATARKLAAEITIEAMKRLQSGPLNYDILARLNYHLAEDLKREESLRLHNEMLSAADEYGAQRVTGETPEINGDRTVLTLLRGGTSGSLTNQQKAIPVVRPRSISYWTSSGKQTVVENEIVVKLAGTPVSLANAEIDFDAGTITFGTALGAGAVTVDYSYATNIALFDLTVPNGVAAEKHFNQLIHLIGTQKATMSGEPRFYPPNFMLMSEIISNELTQAELFSALFHKNGNDLQPNGYVGRVKAIDAYEHNEPWQAGDTRILFGQRLATKFGVGTSMTTKGPFPTRDTNGELTGGEEMYLFADDAIVTPQKQMFRTIRFYNS